LGNEPSRRGTIDLASVEARVSALATRFAMDIDPRAVVRDLSVGQQQRVEIVKALDRGARVLILDEPTAVLTPQEAEGLFRVLRGLAAGGTAIIFISHKLGEVLALAHRIVVMRRGAVVGEVLPEDATPGLLAAMMVGREVMLRVEKPPATPREDRIIVRDVRVANDHGGVAVDGVSFAVRSGEIVGIAGVQGNGQTELVEAISGLRPMMGGTLSLVGVEANGLGVRARSMVGLAHVPEDRQRHGLVLPFTVADNLVLNRYHLPPMAVGWVRHAKAILAVARELVARFDIRPPAPEVLVQSLSGGNKQKVIIARELSHGLQALVAAQPTRGVDVGSIEFIHRSLVEAREAGAAVLVVSAELDELLSIADRILVMYRGRIVAEVSGAEATREGIGLAMAGGVMGNHSLHPKDSQGVPRTL
jgi:simple sugar transport system ATP-binding protein